MAASRLYAADSTDGMRQVIDLLWEIAISIEDGALDDALKNLESIRKELQKALAEGAPPDKIAEGAYAVSMIWNGDARAAYPKLDDAGLDLDAWVWGLGAPLTELWKREHLRPVLRSAADFARLNLEGVSQWSVAVVWAAYRDQPFAFWLGLAFAAAGLLVAWGVLELAGYLLFGAWWRRLVQRPFRDRVFAAFEG